MKKEISEMEWELIETLRNYRNSLQNPSSQIEVYIDTLVETLKYGTED